MGIRSFCDHERITQPYQNRNTDIRSFRDQKRSWNKSGSVNQIWMKAVSGLGPGYPKTDLKSSQDPFLIQNLY